MSNARTLASLIDDTNTRIKIPSGYGLDFADYGAEDSNIATIVGGNLMDDYEEGTFTYTLPCSSSGSYTVRSGYEKGYYTKVGRVVTIALRFESLGKSNPVGDLQLSGLPFATASSPSLGVHTVTESIILRGISSSTQASFYFTIYAEATTGGFTKQATDGTYSAVSVSDVPSNFEGVLVFSYTVS